MKPEMNNDNDPILFVHDEEEISSARIIDFNAYRIGSVRRILSHEVIHADDVEDADEFDILLLAASGRRYR